MIIQDRHPCPLWHTALGHIERSEVSKILR